jgi:hypothetical protein
MRSVLATVKGRLQCAWCMHVRMRAHTPGRDCLRLCAEHGKCGWLLPSFLIGLLTLAQKRLTTKKSTRDAREQLKCRSSPTALTLGAFAHRDAVQRHGGPAGEG